ncbi:HAMP domain-containing sensor histidine kinase [Pedobacter nototheniae]|uniref:sensor histidine kinase n=1 Tax=Pedobacter nototheniae TaxID=2488994 RepID=UPI0029315F4D|nr:HAMP domain-containing sensor histidine kinase [Pedobacter nototheniae]
MKWLSSRYAYPLAIFTIIITVCLQAVWIRQLYIAQAIDINNRLEASVSEASRNATYKTIAQGHEKSVRFQQFFLSAEWISLRQAFDELKIDNLHSQFHYGITRDSSVVEMRISFLNDSSKKIAFRSKSFIQGNDDKQLSLADQQDLKQMDSLVHLELASLGGAIKSNYVVYDYGSGLIKKGMALPKKKDFDFISSKYTYNLKFLSRYQLLVRSTNWLIIYAMRYYLLSSALMLLFTVLAFYLILKLMKNQQLYAHARILFTSNITHELQTPISTINVALDSISKFKLIEEPEKLNNYLDISKFELNRLKVMIDNILKQEEMDHGETKMQFELFDVYAHLSQVIESMGLQTRAKDAEISLLPIPEPLFVWADAMHLTNVFYNLIDNALKYSPVHSKIEITCSAIKGIVVIQFSDNGPGIDELYHQRIFERFFRISGKGDLHNVKGFGLGLHYAKQVIEMHGGDIKVFSRPGKGADFVIHLPQHYEN